MDLDIIHRDFSSYVEHKREIFQLELCLGLYLLGSETDLLQSHFQKLCIDCSSEN